VSQTVQIPVSNMSCAVCAQRVEKALGQVSGVEQAAVNFATEKAQVTYDPSTVNVGTLVDAVRSAGYDVPAVTATFPVTGMNCAACSSRVEKAVQGLPGVVRAAVNLATERVTVTYLPEVVTPGGIARAVEAAGYRMLVGDDGAAPAEPGAAAEEERRRTVSRIRSKFIASLAVGAILMLMMLVPDSWLGMRYQW
jgi:P-type Cu+ transporter